VHRLERVEDARIEPDPRDVPVPFPSELMKMWPISARVNKPENDDPSILHPFEPVHGGVVDVDLISPLASHRS
jgi:hypothetical protein